MFDFLHRGKVKKDHCVVLQKSDLEKMGGKGAREGKRGACLGMIHSFETFGALDGPGLRFVIFFEGCPLRCVFCHNRDMLDLKNYMKMTPQQLLKVVADYKPYFGKKGGVTVSGGDGVYQPKFLLEFLKLCKANGIHTTLDTSLFTTVEVIKSLVPYTDLFMVSLKHFDSEIHKCLTGVPNEKILENIAMLSKIIEQGKGLKKGGIGARPATPGSRLWFRYMILPGYTDTKKNLHALVTFLHKTKGWELIELLPYHTYGVYKWEKLGLKYSLSDVKPPEPSKVLEIKKMLEKEGFKVLLSE
ncbi:MAG: radical SAM protein [Candidatus Gracilibacteria bacterium]|jgi:pyruvate formate lyase activating enzyme